MKNILLTAAAILAISYQANAQQSVKFGPKAGANFSTLSNLSKTKMLPGFYAGAFAEIKFSEKFAFQPELLYSSQGAKNEYSENIAGVVSQHHNHDKLDYINIPLIAKYYFTNAFSVEVGPQLGFLVKADNTDKITLTNGNVLTEERSFKDEVNSFDFGIAAGLAYDITSSFFVNARYNYGFTNVGKSNQYYKDSKNGVTQLGVGYKF